MSGRKHGRGATAKVDCFETWQVIFCRKAGFGEEGIDEGSKVGFSRSVLIEGAIRADAMAEGDVKVEMHRLVGRGILTDDREVAMQSRLEREVLKDVSRSFYLSLRFLPGGFREPTSVGYLLARASDTIADAGDLTLVKRRELLQEFCEWIETGGDFEVPAIKGLPAGEEILMSRLEECREALVRLPDWQRRLVRKVVGIITEGQKWDLERFEGEGVVGLEKDEELRKYTYQVAGCVGEFWTEIGFGVDRDFATRKEAEMMVLGQAYGRSLQLINILRDVPEDLENGRCYLPGAKTRDELFGARQRWIDEARGGLDEADHYAEALNGKRMRFGTILPAMIGRRTLDLLGKASWEEWQSRVKVTRSEVRKIMWEAAKFAYR